MILSILIILIMVVAAIRGFRRGFVKELLDFFSYIVAFVIAFLLADQAATFIRNIENLLVINKQVTNNDILRGLGFLLVFIVLLFIFRILARFLQRIVSLPIIRQLNSILGIIVALVISGLLIMIVMSFLLSQQWEWFNSLYSNSPIAQYIISMYPQVLIF